MEKDGNQSKEINRLQLITDGTPVNTIFGENDKTWVYMAAIRRNYMKLAMVVHPDKVANALCSTAEECVKLLSSAFNVVKVFSEQIMDRKYEDDVKKVRIPKTLLFYLESKQCDDHIQEQVEKMVLESSEETEIIDVEDDGPLEQMFEDIINGLVPLDDNDLVGKMLDGMYEEESSEHEENVWKSGSVLCDTASSHDGGEEVRVDGKIEVGTTSSRDDASPESFRNISEKERKRAMQQRYRQKAAEKAKEALDAERDASNRWVPRRSVGVSVSVGMQFSTRWECDRLCREHSAFNCGPSGVNIHQTTTKLSLTCRTHSCPATLKFCRQPSSGMWRLNAVKNHTDECVGAFEEPSQNGAVKYFSAVYTAKQIARVLFKYVHKNPTISTSEISSIIRAKGIYRRQPSSRHYRAVLAVLMDHMSENRNIEMAAMKGYVKLLQELGHEVILSTVDGAEMKKIRLKAAKYIFAQCVKSGSVDDNDRFDPETIDLSDIENDKLYYNGFTFVPSIAKIMCKVCRKSSAADAVHCQGVGSQSYGTTFEVVLYDTNNHIVPICFSHSVGTESELTWSNVFSSVASIHGFDVPGRVTIVDQEKSIDSGYKKSMKNSALFLDQLHVKKNMGDVIGNEKASGISLYNRACNAPSRAKVEEIRNEYGPKMTQYLSKFPDNELYRAHSMLEDTSTTSQGAESQMRASILNHIQAVEPQQMLSKIVEVQRKRFYQHKSAALACTSPVPPHVDKYLADLILKSRPYQQSVQFIEGSDMMEATVVSQIDASIKRRIFFSTVPHTPPSCCVYSRTGIGFPCYHATAVICQKHGSVNMYRFISSRHLTTSWRKQYEGIEFTVPPKNMIDEVLHTAKQLVLNGQNTVVPVALPSPRRRPSKNASKRLKSWYERSPQKKKTRTCTCGLCGLRNHTSRHCELRQVFEEEIQKKIQKRRRGNNGRDDDGGRNVPE